MALSAPVQPLAQINCEEAIVRRLVKCTLCIAEQLTVEAHPQVDMHSPESMQMSLYPSVLFNLQQALNSAPCLSDLQGWYSPAQVSHRILEDY